MRSVYVAATSFADISCNSKRRQCEIELIRVSGTRSRKQESWKQEKETLEAPAKKHEKPSALHAVPCQEISDFYFINQKRIFIN